MLLLAETQNWPEVVGLSIMMLFLAVILCGWPRIIIHRKCDCKK